MPKTPQDHKKKATKAARYTFTVGEVTHTLPSVTDAMDKISGRDLRDASIEEGGDMALGFKLLEAVGAKPEAVDALLDLPAPKTLEHIHAWMAFKPSEGDASLGESSSSST